MKKILLTATSMAFWIALDAQITDTLSVQVENAKIHSVLTHPAGSPKAPLAIIIAGSGPTDMNGNQTSVKNNSLLYLSDALVAHNIATMRFDKRGIAGSAYPGFKESDFQIDDLANDVIALTDYFKQKGYSDIYIIGHSEGSLIGLIASQNLDIKGFISLCGAGNSADIIIENQLKPQLPAEMFNQAKSIIDSLKNGMNVKGVPPLFYSLFRPSVQPYLISWFKYNPAKLINTLKCPVLILQGNKDIQVDLQESEILANASKNGEYTVINNMNHVLKTIPGDRQENVASYTNPSLPVNEELVKNIVKFIKQK